jgi:hypothetical protein
MYACNRIENDSVEEPKELAGEAPEQQSVGGGKCPLTYLCPILSHPVLEGKPNANHVHARISNSRTQQLHNMDIITQCSNSIKKGNNSRLHHTSETVAKLEQT